MVLAGFRIFYGMVLAGFKMFSRIVLAGFRLVLAGFRWRYRRMF